MEHTGTPEWYVVHSWAGGFVELVQTLVLDLAPEPQPGEPPHPPGFKQGILLWMGA